MNNFPIIEYTLETDDFYMKSITPAFIHHLYDTLDKTKIIDFFGFGESGYENYKNLHENGIETKDSSLFFFNIISKKSQITVGQCGFHSWNKEHKKGEIFYKFYHDSEKGKGSMSKILPLVLDFGFEKLDLNRIQGLVADYNIPSLKLLLKNGFVKEGTLREDYLVDGKFEDSVCYSLLKFEWNK